MKYITVSFPVLHMFEVGILHFMCRFSTVSMTLITQTFGILDILFTKKIKYFKIRLLIPEIWRFLQNEFRS